jgi:hypothetical protein
MAIQRDFTAADMFFLGEDKIIELTIFGQDNVTPLDLTGLAASLEWNMRKTDKAADPAILTKSSTTGLTLVGVYNAVPATNTQRVRLTFVPADTVGLKANFAYRHSLKRKDAGAAGIFTYGSITFLQATEH